MENKSQANSVHDEKDKKKKRPTLQFYQPPQTRNRGSNPKTYDSNKPKENVEYLDKSEAVKTECSVNAGDAANVPENKSKSLDCKRDSVRTGKRANPERKPVCQLPTPRTSSNTTNADKQLPKEQIDEKCATNAENADASNRKKSITSNQQEPGKINKIAGGILKINLHEIDSKTPESKVISTDPTKYKVLFDPYNPTKPLYVHDKNSNSNADDLPKTKSTDTKQQQQQQQQAKNTGQMLNEIKMQRVEQQLKQFIDTLDYQRFSASVDKLNDLRKEYEQHYIESIQINIETAINANQDLNFWKLNYHHIIENLRKEYNSNANDVTVKAYLDSYITDGFRFYEALLVQLETLYNFNFKSLMRNTPVFTSQYLPVQLQNRKFKCVLVCAHRLLISFGDLARYREMFANDAANKDYAIARHYYLQAQKIVPKSSRSYNQLAILALYTRRRLDAVYYYVRCLELNSPLLTARQSLVSLFDEARKHSEELSDNLNNKKNKHVSKTQPTRIDKNTHSNRVELWYKTNETSAKNRNVFSLCSDNDDEDDEKCTGNDNDEFDNAKLNRLSTSELNRRFMNDYLNTIGKLFTKVSMESFEEICSRMLHEFAELLKREPCPLGRMRLLQITMINISIINQSQYSQRMTSQKSTPSMKISFSDELSDDQAYDDNTVLQRSQLQENAIQLCLDMFSLVIRHLTSLFKAIDYDLASIDATIRNLYASVKLFIDWMHINCRLWIPLPDQLPPDLGPNFDFAQLFANFCTCLLRFKHDHHQSGADNRPDGSIRILLDEDIEANGFLPLCRVKPSCITAPDAANIDAHKDIERIQKTLEFANYLCNSKMSLIKYDSAQCVYFSTTPVSTSTKATDHVRIRKQSSCLIAENPADSSTEPVATNDDKSLLIDQEDRSLSDLLEKRKYLKAKVEEQSKRVKNMQTYVEHTSSRKIELEIRPRFLVPDTNCFINNLKLVENILKTGRYIVVIPLLVINELDKLSKSISNYNDDSIEHAEMVQRNAKLSMAYLNEQFENRERNLKAMTSQGSVLETIQFRSEEIKAQGSNDDLILECCLHYCRDNARDYMPQNKDDPIHLFREVVLLTDDRNLRLKAHTRNMPVKNIYSFCKWANISLR